MAKKYEKVMEVLDEQIEKAEEMLGYMTEENIKDPNGFYDHKVCLMQASRLNALQDAKKEILKAIWETK